METFWRNQNAFVAIKSNHVAGSLKDCGAMTALAKMLIDCCSLNKTEISVDIIRDISPDFFAAYSHGFLTSFETHPSRPSCEEVWRDISDYIDGDLSFIQRAAIEIGRAH